jgi:hypothetical protein
MADMIKVLHLVKTCITMQTFALLEELASSQRLFHPKILVLPNIYLFWTQNVHGLVQKASMKTYIQKCVLLSRGDFKDMQGSE